METRTQKIDNRIYYSATDLKEYYPIHFYGTNRIPRNIIKLKKIPKEDYIFASFNKKKGWTTYNEKDLPNKVNLYLSEKWTNENIINSSDTTYEEAPNIIVLKEQDKFSDADGNKIEVEIRGERSPDKIFYLAKDIATAFDMPYLNKTLIDKKNTYTKDHYKIFIYDNKKHIFITFRGIMKIIFCSRNPNTKYNDLILMNWVQNTAGICSLRCDPVLTDLREDVCFGGIVYFITCELLNGVKIGFWRASLDSLRDRFQTYYGKDINIYYCRSPNAPELENKIHNKFTEYNITNELFKKDTLLIYLDYVVNEEKLEIIRY